MSRPILRSLGRSRSRLVCWAIIEKRSFGVAVFPSTACLRRADVAPPAISASEIEMFALAPECGFCRKAVREKLQSFRSASHEVDPTSTEYLVPSPPYLPSRWHQYTNRCRRPMATIVRKTLPEKRRQASAGTNNACSSYHQEA